MEYFLLEWGTADDGKSGDDVVNVGRSFKWLFFIFY